jgi:signal transduction histidine kinase
VDDYLAKPFDRLEMRARVRSIARLNRYRRLLAERARFAWVAEQSEDGYLTVNEAGAVLYANPAARVYLGLPAEANAPITESFLELARKQYRPEPEEAWAGWPRVSDDGGPRTRYLVRPETPTAQPFWLKVDLLDLRSGAEPVWQVRLRDVSEQIASQRGLEQFHRAIVHKLRTPLVGIVGGLELMSHHALDLSKEDVVEMTGIALRAAQRLRGEIDDILQYLHAPALARSGGGFRLSELSPLAAGIAAGLGLEAVTVSVPEGLGETLVALSRQAVESILWEILENSRKFHPAHSPTVEIEVWQSDSQTIQLRVRDNGVTLSPEQLARVWRPYYQGEKYFTGEMAGMGLGLPGVASLIWEVNGACRIYNRDDGPGVVVELDLPAADGG